MGIGAKLISRLESFMTSPPMPHATATTAAARKRLAVVTWWNRTCRSRSTMTPKSSIGLTPVVPVSHPER